MAKRSSPLISLFKKISEKLSLLWQPSLEKLELLPADSLPIPAQALNASKGPSKWVLAETSDNDDNNKNVVMVEVEYFPDTYDFSKQAVPLNYTIEGEDPNLRITHYPSNRLH